MLPLRSDGVSSSRDYRVHMLRCYFHIRDSQGVVLEDSEGLEFPDLESARKECRTIIQSVLNETEDLDRLGDIEFHVVDEHGNTVVVVPFRA